MLSAVKGMVKKIVQGPKASPEAYVRHLREAGARIGNDVIIYAPAHTLIDESYPWMLSIGDHVRICQGVILLAHDYAWSVLKVAKQGRILGASGRVTIGNNVFIGMNTIVTRGITIGNHVIIGAGSVVTKDCQDNGVYAGNPARRIAELDDYLKKRTEAQVEEARELAVAYEERFHQQPPKEIFHEYFMLFESAESARKQAWCREKMRLGGNEAESSLFMEENERPFKDYEAFMAFCFQGRSKDATA